MKNINYVINGVLAVAVVILYIMQERIKRNKNIRVSGRHNGLTSDRLCKCGFPVT